MHDQTAGRRPAQTPRAGLAGSRIVHTAVEATRGCTGCTVDTSLRGRVSGKGVLAGGEWVFHEPG